MTFSLDDFIRVRPFLFHLTANANIRRIRRMRSLYSAERIFNDAGRTSSLQLKRRQHEIVQIGGETVHVRDQAPLHAGNTELSGGWTFEDFVQNLNQKVFFWPGTSRGPISYGVRHFERYREEGPAIIRVPTASLFSINQRNPPLFCRFNSGSPRCSKGRPSPRSPLTFMAAGQVMFSATRVVEVVFEELVVLPEDAEISSTVSGPWKSI